MRLLKALGVLWAIILGTWLTIFTGLLLTVTDTSARDAAGEVVLAPTAAIVDAATGGATEPSEGRLFFMYVIGNGGVALLFYGVLYFIRMADPHRANESKRRHRLVHDPITCFLFSPFKFIWKTRAPELQPLLGYLMLGPLIFAVISGLRCGMLSAMSGATEPSSAGILLVNSFLTILPHAIFELSGVMLPLALMLELHWEIDRGPSANDLQAISTVLHTRTAAAQISRLVLTSVVLIVIAACIEAFVTPRIPLW